MKVKNLLRRNALLSVAVAAMAVAGLLTISYRVSGIEDEVIPCEESCSATIEVPGTGTFEGKLNGTLSATTGIPTTGKNGLNTTPFWIRGSAMRGYIAGLGETMLWLDQSRPIAGSNLREKQPGTGFPATLTMRSHLLLTSEIFPGRTLRTMNPFVVRSNNVNSLPPRAAVFQLVEAVHFEDIERPGEVAFTMLKGRAVINPVHGGLDPIDQRRPRAEQEGR